MTREALLQEALKLPHNERADVAAELLASLDEEPAEGLEEVEKAWATETERRARRVLAGGSAGVPWEQVKQRLDRLSCVHPDQARWLLIGMRRAA